MKLHYSTLEDLKRAAWRFFEKGADIAVDTKNLIITVYKDAN